MGYNILFFPWRDWDTMEREGFRTREANLLIALIKNPNVDNILCVNRPKIPGYVRYVLNVKNKKMLFKKPYNNNQYREISITSNEIKKTGLFSKLKKVNGKLNVLDIIYYLPNPKGNKLERLNIFKRILLQEVKKSINILEFDNYLTWCFDLTRIDVANTLKKDLLIFDAIDNLLEHDQNKKDCFFLEKCYKSARANAELIFTVSRDLKNTLFFDHKNVFYLPNAINQQMYKRRNITLPNDLPKDKKTVGYVGLLQERIDLEVLETSITYNKNVNFIFIGPVLAKGYFDKLKKYKNVYFLGPKHHTEVPSYISFFDVCIIPHKLNKFTKSMNPLKLYEYLAAGKEVITTPVPPSEEFKSVIHICENKDVFARKIKEVLNNPFCKFSKQDVIDSVKGESWEHRLEQMLKLIDNEIENRRRRLV
ncbi:MULTISPECIES: glycosyltransferase [Heyndrickxia]|nr:glycosyltransferase [Weizmannia acidilactici]NWN97486.1 glycosyltransferase [Bacillus sp. (in: firmicutes)]